MAMLHEEVIYSRLLAILAVIPLISMSIGLYVSLTTGEGVAIMLPAAAMTFAIILETMAFRVRIYEDRIVLSGFLGIFLRKTIKIDEIEWFTIRDGWMSCPARMHFTLPAKACVYLKRKKGWDVSFSTNRPADIETVLTSLGVPLGA